MFPYQKEAHFSIVCELTNCHDDFDVLCYLNFHCSFWLKNHAWFWNHQIFELHTLGNRKEAEHFNLLNILKISFRCFLSLREGSFQPGGSRCSVTKAPFGSEACPNDADEACNWVELIFGFIYINLRKSLNKKYLCFLMLYFWSFNKPFIVLTLESMNTIN